MTQPATQSAVDAEIDDHLNTLKNSRQLFYRGGDGAEAKSRRRDSWFFLSTSDEAFPDISDDEEDDSDNAEVSRPNLKEGDQMDHDYMKKAEGLFYKEDDNVRASATSTDTADDSIFTASTSAEEAPSGVHPETPLFDPTNYDNVEHRWTKRPFVVKQMRTFFGTIRSEKMDQIIQSKMSRIAKTGSCDSERLVLSDLGKPFGCKLYFSVTTNTDNLQRSNNHFKVEHLDGLWLSKVYRGAYTEFSNWVDQAVRHVKEKYDKRVTPQKNFFAYYPSNWEKKNPEETLAVFFIKVGQA